jgi:uncharacterized membrane protein
MTGAEIALIIGNIATLITAIGGFIVLLRRTEITPRRRPRQAWQCSAHSVR